MIYDNDKAVEVIRQFIKKKRKEKLLYSSNRPVREDIFEIIEKASIVLYFPLNDTGIKGCHMKRIVNGEVEQFVFINTSKSVQEQTWTAAHELGHVWEVDNYTLKMIEKDGVSSEDIVNRFASEVLFPNLEFKTVFREYRKNIGIEGNTISKYQFMQIVTYMMNYFCAPYKAIIRRFVELKMISPKNEVRYIHGFEQNEDYYKQLLAENYYPRLDRISKACNMEHIREDIEEICRRHLASPNTVEYYKRLFCLRNETVSEDTFTIMQRGTVK